MLKNKNGDISDNETVIISNGWVDPFWKKAGWHNISNDMETVMNFQQNLAEL
jgi:hypothetical protein